MTVNQRILRYFTICLLGVLTGGLAVAHFSELATTGFFWLGILALNASNGLDLYLQRREHQKFMREMDDCEGRIMAANVHFERFVSGASLQ